MLFLKTSSFTRTLETFFAGGAQLVVPDRKNDDEWTALAAVRLDNEHDTWTEHVVRLSTSPTERARAADGLDGRRARDRHSPGSGRG